MVSWLINWIGNLDWLTKTHKKLKVSDWLTRIVCQHRQFTNQSLGPKASRRVVIINYHLTDWQHKLTTPLCYDLTDWLLGFFVLIWLTAQTDHASLLWPNWLTAQTDQTSLLWSNWLTTRLLCYDLTAWQHKLTRLLCYDLTDWLQGFFIMIQRTDNQASLLWSNWLTAQTDQASLLWSDRLTIRLLYYDITDTQGAGIAQWLEHRTRDWKVAGSNPCWNGGRIFFSRVDFLCWLLFRYPFHPRVTTVARKKSRSFCQKCRHLWQVTAKHAYTLRMWILLNRASALWHNGLTTRLLCYDLTDCQHKLTRLLC